MPTTCTPVADQYLACSLVNPELYLAFHGVIHDLQADSLISWLTGCYEDFISVINDTGLGATFSVTINTAVCTHTSCQTPRRSLDYMLYFLG